MPLWAFDQVIVTPANEDPPNLTDPNIPFMGSRRFQRVNEFRREIDELKFLVEETYTFCFWGISRFLDKIQWELRGIPLITPLDFNKFCGRPPVHVVLFTLTSAHDEREKRYLQYRKNYYFDLAFWSSKKRPSQKHIEPLIGKLQEGKNVSRQVGTPWWRRNLACCGPR